MQVISPDNKDVTLAATTNVLPAGTFYVTLPAIFLIALICKKYSCIVWQVDEDNTPCEEYIVYHMWTWIGFILTFIFPGIINLLQLMKCQINH
jgi:hypothetical protein